jgi:serine protease Do
VVVNEMTPEVAAKLNVDPELRAPFVANVTPGAPAEKAGVKPYDVLLELDGKPVHNSTELVLTVTGIDVNRTVPLKISRGGSEKTLQITVAQRPGAGELAQGVGPAKPKKGKKVPAKVDTGMALEDVTPGTARELLLGAKAKGAVVVSTAYGAAADKAGIVRGDLIIEVDRKPVKDVESFYALVKDKKSYLVRIRRLDAQGAESFSVVVLDLK